MVDGLTWNIVTIIIRNAPHPPSPDGPPWGSTQGQADPQGEDQHLGRGRVSTESKTFSSQGCFVKNKYYFDSTHLSVSQMEMDPF